MSDERIEILMLLGPGQSVDRDGTNDDGQLLVNVLDAPKHPPIDLRHGIADSLVGSELGRSHHRRRWIISISRSPGEIANQAFNRPDVNADVCDDADKPRETAHLSPC